MLFVAFWCLVRARIAAYIPIMEFSEARYAEIARKLLFEPNWITLWYTELMPFWGKPPLAFWATAWSFELFGVGELSARLPSIVATLGTALLLYMLVKRQSSESQAGTSTILYLTLALVIHTAGAVITDPILILCTTAVMTGFWLAVQHRQGRWGDVMCVALGLVLMTKGPIALIMPGLACAAWVAIRGEWRAFFTAFHWITGPALMLIVGVPWYIFAEQATSGFLEHFIVGEHFSRFTEPTWEGDPYGAVKDMPRGSVWVFLIVASAPWSLAAGILLAVPAWRRKVLLLTGDVSRDWLVYLMCWALIPAVFFTLARNVLVTYVLPAMPAVAILCGLCLTAVLSRRVIVSGATAMVVLFGAASIVGYERYYAGHKYNQRPIIRTYHEYAATDPGRLIYTGNPKFSATFYTAGDVTFTRHVGRLFYGRRETLYMAVGERWYGSLSKQYRDTCDQIARSNDISLWYCPASRIP